MKQTLKSMKNGAAKRKEDAGRTDKPKRLGASRAARACLAAIAAAVLAFSSACGGVPKGIVEDDAREAPESVKPTELYTSTPNMDLTPDDTVKSGLSTEKSGETTLVTLHYITDEGYVLPLKTRIEKQDGIAKACLVRLVSSKDNEREMKSKGISCPIPAGTEIQLAVSDGEARVNLIGMPKLDSSQKELCLFASVVNTLTQFRSIDRVTLFLDGKAEPTPNGNALPDKAGSYALNVEDGSLETAAVENAAALTLYYPNASGSIFVPTTRYVKGKSDLYAALSQLAAGTKLEGLRSCFPEDTLILGAAIENGVLNINCSTDFLKVQELPGLYSLCMQSALMTAAPFGSIDEILFSVNGVPFEPVG